MRRVCFESDIFTSPEVMARSEKALDRFLIVLYQMDVDYLKDNPDTPGIYNAGVHYRKEPVPLEAWKTIPIVLQDGYGDCEDLACWRAAELSVRHGIQARPVWYKKTKGRFNLYHIIVKCPDGKKEDPSRRLGMGKI